MVETYPSDFDLAHAVCAGCGCFCDDIVLRFRGEDIDILENACEAGESWFRKLGPLKPTAFASGKPVTVEEAVRLATDLLTPSLSPVVLGLGQLTVEALREVTTLAWLSKAR